MHTTTPTNVLDQLAAAWGSAPPIDPAPITIAPTRLEPVTPAPTRLERPTAICRWHVAPFDLIDTDDRTRPGYVRSVCRACGRFVGYRRADK